MSVYDKRYTVNEFQFTRGYLLEGVTDKSYLFYTGEADYEVELYTIGYLKTIKTGTDYFLRFEIFEYQDDVVVTDIGTPVNPTILVNRDRTRQDDYTEETTTLTEEFDLAGSTIRLLVSKGIANDSGVDSVTELNYRLKLKKNTYYELRMGANDGTTVVSNVDGALRGVIREVS